MLCYHLDLGIIRDVILHTGTYTMFALIWILGRARGTDSQTRVSVRIATSGCTPLGSQLLVPSSLFSSAHLVGCRPSWPYNWTGLCEPILYK